MNLSRNDSGLIPRWGKMITVYSKSIVTMETKSDVCAVLHTLHKRSKDTTQQIYCKLFVEKRSTRLFNLEQLI